MHLSDLQSKSILILLYVCKIISFLLEIGLGLTIFGFGFIFLGMIFLFDRGLLAIGNVNIRFHVFFLFYINSILFHSDIISQWSLYDYWS